MGKLVIFDTEHFEVLATLLRLFESGGHVITVYTDEGSFHQLRFNTRYLESVHWEIRKANESRRAFISRFARQLRLSTPDLLFISSAPDNHALLAWKLRRLKEMPVLLTLHDINSYFRTPSGWSLKSLVRAAGKKMLYRRADALHVLSGQQRRYLLSDLQVRKNVLVIPGAVHEPRVRPDFTRPLRIVVAGSVDDRRRDYSQVFRLLEVTAASGAELSVTLLGGFSPDHGTRIRERCEAWSRNHTNLRFYDQPVVDQPEFDRVLADSHFLWTPLQPGLVLEYGITEEYGRSISSGNTGDMIRMGCPVILPSGLPMDEAHPAGSIRYATVEDLAAQLASLNSILYNNMADAASAAAADYSVTNVVNANLPLFSTLVISKKTGQENS
ncbi:MAG: hypothetical protein EOO09_09940 [Chitinophagaceae bacterium]|nr:MAG: hypothetical protein EOO09_09940 [Chitinophagaceae bacterium]